MSQKHVKYSLKNPKYSLKYSLKTPNIPKYSLKYSVKWQIFQDILSKNEKNIFFITFAAPQRSLSRLYAAADAKK